MLEFKDFDARVTAFAEFATPLERRIRKNFRYAALDQWDASDREKLENEGRPALVFDNTRAVIDTVAGSEISNRFEVQFYPRNLPGDDIDAQASETIQEVHRWVRQQSDVEQQESAAFRDMVICGYGATNTYMDYADNPDGRIVTQRIPILEVGWDPTATQTNVADADFVFMDNWVDEDYFRKRYPGAESYRAGRDSGNQSLWSRISPIANRGRDTYQNTRLNYFDAKSRKVHLWEYQYREKNRQVRVLVPNLMGGMDEVWLDVHGDEDKLKAFIDITAEINKRIVDIGGEPIGEVDWNEQDRYDYRRAVIAGKEILEDYADPTRSFSIQLMTGFEDWSHETRKYHFGLMSTMEDPQNYVNKFFSQAVHMWSTSPKGVLLYEADLFENPDQAGKEWAKADGAIPVKTGTLSLSPRPKFQHVSVNRTFGGAESLFAFAEQAIPKAAGVNLAYSSGLTQDLRRTAASAVQSVQQQNFVTLSTLFDSMRLYRKRQARVVLGMVREYLPEDQIMRIIGPDGPSVVQFTKDDLIQEYDIVVDESPVSPNRQQMVFDNLVATGLLNVMLEQGIVPPSLWKYLPLPTDVGTDIGQMMMQQQQMQQQMMMQQSQGAPPPPA